MQRDKNFKIKKYYANGEWHYEHWLGECIVKSIPFQTARDIVEQYHYSHVMPQCTRYRFGFYEIDLDGNEDLVAVCSFGVPSSPTVAKALVGEERKHDVLELNRLACNDASKYRIQVSELISKCLHLLPRNTIVISYADTAQGHHGGVYRASNFRLYGMTKAQLEYNVQGHALGYRKLTKEERQKLGYRRRSSKYRYVYCCNKHDWGIIKYDEMGWK